MWPVVLLLYLVDTALALVLVQPPAAHLERLFGRSAMAPGLSGPITMNMLAEVASYDSTFSIPLGIYPLVAAIALVTGTFLRGGVLGTMAREGGPFRWSDFFADCGRFFPRLALMLLFFIPGLVMVAAIFAPAGLLTGLLLGYDPTGAAILLGLLSLLLALLRASMDYARISLVLDPGRSIFRHLWRGLAFLVRRFPGVLLLALAFWLATLLIILAYPALAAGTTLASTLVPAIVAQQLATFIHTWERVASLAGEMDLYRTWTPGHPRADHAVPPTTLAISSPQ